MDDRAIGVAAALPVRIDIIICHESEALGLYLALILQLFTSFFSLFIVEIIFIFAVPGDQRLLSCQERVSGESDLLLGMSINLLLYELRVSELL